MLEKETIQDIRCQMLLSREKMSEKTGASVSLIKKWENGQKEITDEQVKKLAGKLNISSQAFYKSKPKFFYGVRTNILLILISIVSLAAFIASVFVQTLEVKWFDFVALTILIFMKAIFRKYRLSDILFVPIILFLAYIIVCFII